MVYNVHITVIVFSVYNVHITVSVCSVYNVHITVSVCSVYNVHITVCVCVCVPITQLHLHELSNKLQVLGSIIL